MLASSIQVLQGLSLATERRLRGAAEATRQHNLRCKCESAVVPAALPPALQAGGSRVIATLLSPQYAWGSPALGPAAGVWQAEPAAGVWRTTANAAADVIHDNLIPAN